MNPYLVTQESGLGILGNLTNQSPERKKDDMFGRRGRIGTLSHSKAEDALRANRDKELETLRRRTPPPLDNDYQKPRIEISKHT